jgi:3-dehydroquinate dehydratase
MLSRIDFCWEGQFLTFAVLDNASAPGQMDYKQAYNYLTS